MNNLRLSLITLALAAFATASAQAPLWDREKYPDLPDPKPKNINYEAYRKMVRRVKRNEAEGKRRPDHINNALNPSFPPIINQSGGSCGAASSIYYQFTNQINTARFSAADSDERRYATHFPWMLNTNGTGGTGYDRLGRDVGIASVAVYGGTTYSRIYGNSGQDDQDDDCGWMQGYDSWFATMHNRILTGNSFPMNCGTPEGREIVKNYLWNRCGDDSYASGGICGIGVAAGPFEGNIPKTEVNDAVGVTGMKYITDWNETYNHAMTIVGYDDRIEFDLDGNGVVGEEMNADGDNEVGAWIICNSWGDGYANNGFIYCPYEKSNSVKGWPKENSFTPGFYDVMRDYRPLRTIRVKMEYTRRSEICLNVGVAQDVNATKPEKSITLTHFNYCGDGNQGKTQPAPEIPMLGRWFDGLHPEPMEFGYDLTDLTSDFDLSRPLKYFFWVETRSWGEGEGKIHEVSILDYTLDRDGVEVPFPLEGPVDVPSKGRKTQLTAVVLGEAVPVPSNLAIDGTELSWQLQAAGRFTPASFRIYQGGELLTSVDGQARKAQVEGSGSYSVSAVYEVNGYDVESKRSASVISMIAPAQGEAVNTIASLKKGNQIIIPHLVEKATPDFTLEFWFRPRSNPSSDFYGIKATTTNFFFKMISGGQVEIGHDGGDYTRSSGTISSGTFHHVAIVNEGLSMQVFVDGKRFINWASRYNHKGLEGATDLVFGRTEGTTSNYKVVYDAPWVGDIDEIRFWTCARTPEQIKNDYKTPIAYPHLHEHLTHYYTMSTRTEGDDIYLVDSKGESDAQIINSEDFALSDLDYHQRLNPLDTLAYADFETAASVVAGRPLPVHDLSSLGTVQWEWNFTGAAQEQITGTVDPVVIFREAGTQTVRLKTTNLFGQTSEKTAEVEVVAAQLPSVDFRVPEGEIGAGQHVTFVNTSTPIDAATYEWEIEGADNPVVKTANAAATFAATGTYNVKLKAYNELGTTSKTKTISIVGVKPQAAFTIQNNIVLRGEKINLIDDSKFAPKKWTWDLASGVEIYRVEGQNKAVSLDVPGIYDVTLTAENDKGSSVLRRSRAVVVCNADGKNGLKFDGEDDLVESASPFGETTPKAFSIDWWMFPGRTTDASFHLGDDASTLRISLKPNGQFVVESSGKSLQSPEGTVITDEWHHYTITFKSGAFTFYRDEEKVGSGRLSGVNVLPVLARFAIGGKERPVNALIDEFRVWNYAIAQKDILGVANAPVADPETNDSLLLYYDFNQNGGNVIDRSGHGLEGQRLNFGPDGDAWESTKGIFCLNPKGTFNDVTADYLKNYKHPFKSSGTCNPANSSRYLRLLMNRTTSPWVQKNTVRNGSIYTEWHVDAQKNNYLTLEDTYSGFEEVIKDLMIFQTVELPEGEYTFIADRDGDDYYYNWLTDGTYVAAAAGEELPLTADLEEQALASSPLSESSSISFSLSEPTRVSLGLIANMSDKKCVAVGKFVLLQKVVIHEEGTDIDPTDDISRHFVSAEASLQAAGGYGCLRIQVSQPQHVTVSDLSGKVLFHEWLDSNATIPVRRGIYVVNRQKVIVR